METQKQTKQKNQDDEEIIEGLLTCQYDWVTDISETITIPAEYETITKEVPRTRTVRKKTGTKQELVTEGYWK